MTPEEFIKTWQSNKLNERAGAQAHFMQLCVLLGVDPPLKEGEYQFERGAKKAGGGDGWADVWKRGHFAWENKKPGRDLGKALKQLTDYTLQLESPPLLVVSDRERIVIHTAFTGYPDQPREVKIEELVDESKRQLLRWVFTDPLKLRPEKSSAAITAEAAERFAALAEAMRQRGEDPDVVAHFLVQCLFCMFAEDEGLLPDEVFTTLLTKAGTDATRAADRIVKLFKAMGEPSGEYGDETIQWFNGGLFKNITAPKLTTEDVATLRSAAASMDWRAIDPTIFGTLFERGLGDKRAPLGAHYTDTATITKLVDPLVRESLLVEWEATKQEIAKLMLKADIFGQPAKTSAEQKARTTAHNRAKKLHATFLNRLNQFRVLDPACGSGNFLYLSLKALRDVEKRVRVAGQELGLPEDVTMQTGPHNILGLELNEFAAELARVTVWIGDIQWCRQNGWQHSINPILKPLDGIENRDALVNEDGTETEWPKADVIVGNPPFLGNKMMRTELGDNYVEKVRGIFEGRVSGGVDLVCYWFEKARAQIEAGNLQAAGLVSTNSIRGGANRKVLERIEETSRIFVAWSDEEWVNDGAAVRVSMIGFGKRDSTTLDGQPVAAIHADLTADVGVNLTKAKRLPENSGLSFMGITKSGPFDLAGDVARKMLLLTNPNGRPNADVLRPSFNGQDLAKRPSDHWIVNFGTMSEPGASLYEAPFDHAVAFIKPERQKSKTPSNREKWWIFERPRPEMFAALDGKARYIATIAVAKHRTWSWLPSQILPDHALIVVAKDDDATFGILHSRLHELWSLRMGTSLEDRPRYTPTTCFETFPFPEGLTPRDTKAGVPDTAAAKAIATAAQELDSLRNNWLNPPELVDWVCTPEEQKAGFPLRPVAKPGKEDDLRKLTLTSLYNQYPAWLRLRHEALNKAVADAYGWADYTPAMSDEEILRRLLALNQARAAGAPAALAESGTREKAKKAKLVEA